ncbi:hypothetical protein LCGC14_1899690 [marine sediment metagenome]|uniref:Uncharacterized protein n=1 Tax=marine sediment metagenome TaxID=412755 RepID=A0A0F9GKC9_9ZZZZ
MSRSRRKTPIVQTCCAFSERDDKVIWHSRMRAVVRDRLFKALDNPEGYIDVLRNEVSDPWDFAKDGKTYYTPDDIKNYPEIMRK